MARNYSYIDDWVTYVPDYEGNRNEKDPITVEIKPLTVREAQRRAKNVTARRVKGGGIQSDTIEINQKTFVSHVRNIQNLSANGQPITAAEELLDTPLNTLVAEIDEAMTELSTLNEGDVKNYERRPDGYLERKPGTATSAMTSDEPRGTVQEHTGE